MATAPPMVDPLRDNSQTPGDVQDRIQKDLDAHVLKRQGVITQGVQRPNFPERAGRSVGRADFAGIDSQAQINAGWQRDGRNHPFRIGMGGSGAFCRLAGTIGDVTGGASKRRGAAGIFPPKAR